MRFNPLIILSLGLCLSLSSWVNADIHAAGSKAAALGKMSELQANPLNNDEVKLARKLASASTKGDYSILAKSLCAMYDGSRILVTDTKRSILEFIKEYENIENPTTEDAIYYLNQHKNEMICYGTNYLNYAFERKAYNQIIVTLFAGELYSEENPLDFNAITITMNPETKKEEPMTVLDYINKVALKTTSISGSKDSQREIKQVRGMLIEYFGAKSFSDLTLAEKGEFATP